jgi:hypothetical protein
LLAYALVLDIRLVVPPRYLWQDGHGTALIFAAIGMAASGWEAPVNEQAERTRNITHRDTHGFEIASRMIDEGDEEAALGWLREHEALPWHSASACPFADVPAVAE